MSRGHQYGGTSQKRRDRNSGRLAEERACRGVLRGLPERQQETKTTVPRKRFAQEEKK